MVAMAVALDRIGGIGSWLVFADGPFHHIVEQQACFGLCQLGGDAIPAAGSLGPYADKTASQTDGVGSVSDLPDASFRFLAVAWCRA